MAKASQKKTVIVKSTVTRTRKSSSPKSTSSSGSSTSKPYKCEKCGRFLNRP